MKLRILTLTAFIALTTVNIDAAKVTSYCATGGYFSNDETSTRCQLEKLWKTTSMAEALTIEANLNKKIKQNDTTTTNSIKSFYQKVTEKKHKTNNRPLSELASYFASALSKLGSKSSKDITDFKNFLRPTDGSAGIPFGYYQHTAKK